MQRLSQNDPLAVRLAPETLETACLGRDRPLLLSLFYFAPERLLPHLWRKLTLFDRSSLWLLNPLFISAGLPPLRNFQNLGIQEKVYLGAVLATPYFGSRYRSPDLETQGLA